MPVRFHRTRYRKSVFKTGAIKSTVFFIVPQGYLIFDANQKSRRFKPNRIFLINIPKVLTHKSVEAVWKFWNRYQISKAI